MTEWANENAGVIILESIPEEIRSVFSRKRIETMPLDLAKTISEVSELDWNQAQYASELAIVNLLGGWNEKSDSDKEIVKQLAKEDFGSWLHKMQEILQWPSSPLSLKNGIWSITQRQKLWQTLGMRLFDDHLDIFKRCDITVLTERDPSFDLEPSERYAANIYGKVLKHSHFIREGLAESLALIGSQPEAITNCSLNKPEAVAVLAIREILENADWVLWGSLNDLLPLLSEASPGEFLGVIENALSQNPCPFDKLFAQEGNGVTGRNYLTGLLWALEGLAWDEQYLARVSVILGELASRDPGGNWANRPANSLTTIFLPWLPQTTASIEKRQVAIRTLLKENPEEAWKLLMSLLPDSHQISSGCHRPRWRKIIPDNWDKKVSPEEYREQVSTYVGMAVEMAKGDLARLNEVIRHLGHLTPEYFDKVLDYLSSKEIIENTEEHRLQIWENLVELASRHKRHADAEWAMSSEAITKIETVAENLAPKNPANLYHRLFSGRDFDLYEEKSDWQEQQKKLEERRQEAIKKIFEYGKINAVVDFAKAVESPWNVGFSLGHLPNNDIDSVILPDILETGDKKLSQFSGGFVWARYSNQGWNWADKLIKPDTWTQLQISQFLAYLPFISETAKRAENLLGEHEVEYWSKANVNPYHTKDDINWAIDKLIKYDRPNSAIFCLSRNLHYKQSVDSALAIKALLAAVSSKEAAGVLHTHDIIDIITALQNDPKTDQDELFQVEWAYLPLLNVHNGGSPRVLEERLASDYKFFCEIIRLIYKSEKGKESEKEPTEQQKAVATNAYRLLSEWRRPPGLMSDGSFSEDYFKKWLEAVKKACSESGHFYVALSSLGHVLIYAPPDPSGLWINKTIADALNSKDAEAMRSGYSIGVHNLRGVHWVDPTGKPELELSAKYNKQADEIENAGYHRFTVTLRSLTDSYTKDAKRILTSII